MNTGENSEGLRKILDLTRKIGLILLLLHFLKSCHLLIIFFGLDQAFYWEIISSLLCSPFSQVPGMLKIIALLAAGIYLIGNKPRKDLTVSKPLIWACLLLCLILFLSSFYFWELFGRSITSETIYIGLTFSSYLGIMVTGIVLKRLSAYPDSSDIFNKLNESFPQEERLLVNEYSINLPAVYKINGKTKKSWINFINPFRAILVVGTPGSGKSYFVIRHVIWQHISKGFTMFVYDFKFDDLSRIAYNALLSNQRAYKLLPRFYTINFDDLEKTHRCNPLEPSTMTDITDASEASRTIMLGLNREWIKKQGDFFVESPINFLTAVIWFLKKYKKGVYCTLPHVIELMQTDYDRLFSVLRTEPEIEVLINPFVSAYLHGAAEQLEGQIASAKITMARLSSPQLYYVLSSSEFSLDINNPMEPKIVCMGNNPQKQQVYGAVLSLYVSRLTKLANRKGMMKSSLIFDEFPTIYFNGIDSLIATARSNKVATVLGVQDYSQLKKDYGREQAEVIMNTVGNIISGQVLGETAKQLSERFGKILQNRKSTSINSNDVSHSFSKQLDLAVPTSTISTLSSGEFVGVVADNPDQEIQLKRFHSCIVNDHQLLAKQDKLAKPIPKVRSISPEEVRQQYQQIKLEVHELVASELDRMLDTPALTNLIILKPR
jgi:hypothetical protein